MKTLKQTSLISFSHGLIIFSLILGLMVVGRSVIVPIAWALMIGFSSVHVLRKIHSKVKLNWGVICFLYLLLVLSALIGVMTFFAVEMQRIVQTASGMESRLLQVENQLTDLFSTFGFDFNEVFSMDTVRNQLSNISAYILSFARDMGGFLGDLLLVFLYSFFVLLYSGDLLRFYHLKAKNEEEYFNLRKFNSKLIEIIGSFLNGLIITALMLSVVVYISLLILGVDYALFWAVLAGVLSLIPYLGIPMAMVLIVIYSFLTSESWLTPTLVFGAIFLANMLQENVFKPVVIGDKLKLNALTIFLTVIVGSTIWGVSGMILFIPIAGIAKVVLERKAATLPYAVFLGPISDESMPEKDFEHIDQHEMPEEKSAKETDD
ncbi:MAG: AI-2E family transporter [Cyclobacteriaceae bacterium]